MKYQCKYCSFECEQYAEYLKHMRIHQDEQDFSLKCESCHKICKSVAVYKKHRHWHQVKDARDTITRSAESGLHDDGFSHQDSSESIRDRSPHHEAGAGPSTSSFLDRTSSTTLPGSSWIDVADFVLSLRTKSVPKKVCQNIVQEFQRFGSRVQAEAECHRREESKSTSSPTEAASPSLEGLSNVNTYHKLLKFSKEERCFIDPIPQFADDQSTGKPVSQYVPLACQLRACLERQDFPGHAIYHEELNMGKYKDIFDGYLHQQGKEHLHLIFYYDEFNIANPIGNKTSKHSIGAIYYCIANAKNLSSLSDIHVAMLFHSRDVKKLSWEKILSPLVEEMTLIEKEGVWYMHNDKPEFMKCIISMFVCDNKGSHQLAGYYTSFHRTSRICRHCHATTDDIQTMFDEILFEERTCEQYDCEISHLKMEQFDSNIQKIFGIKEECVLNKVPSFHCIRGFPVDVTHDLFEGGVVTRTLEKIIGVCVQKKIFSLESLNYEISKFPYHRIDVNRPQGVRKASSGVTISETCSETWTLLRLSLLMLSKLIKDDKAKAEIAEELEVLRLLIDLVQRIMADEFSDSSITELKTAIAKWLALFHRLFPDFQMTPKFHNLVHYPSQVLKHGPLKKYSTIRYEAKHSEMKRYLANSKNRINPCKSMAEAHQVASGLRLSSSKHGEMQTGKQCVVYKGCEYKSGDCISVQDCEDGMKLIEITGVNRQVSETAVCGVKFGNVEHDNSIMAFRVSQEEPVSSRLEELFHFHPMGLYNLNGVKYAVPQFKSQFEHNT